MKRPRWKLLWPRITTKRKYEAFASNEFKLAAVEEWEMLDDAALPGEPDANVVEKRTNHIKYNNSSTKAKLTTIHQQLDLPQLKKKNPNKRSIFDAILDSGKVQKLSNDEFIYEYEVVPKHLQGPIGRSQLGKSSSCLKILTLCSNQQGTVHWPKQTQLLDQYANRKARFHHEALEPQACCCHCRCCRRHIYATQSSRSSSSCRTSQREGWAVKLRQG